jgi:membrane protease subunit (stomatin/prohibitin family)
MGVLDFLGKQFIDVIEWNEESDGVLAYRYPMRDQEIQNGAQLTVRESQLALFVNEGKVADLFSPGLYTLQTKTLPILTNLKNWDKAFASPFKSDVYFFSTRTQIDQKWGTATPITIRDKEYGPIRVGGYGIYSYLIKDPKLMFTKISGTRDVYRTTDLEGQLRSIIATFLASFLGTSEISFVDMAANQGQFSEVLKSKLSLEFDKYGLLLDSFFVQSVSLPEELQKRLDERAGMRMVGDMRNYTQFQAAQSIPIAAANEGGVAGAGAGLGAGMAMGQAMSQAFTQSLPNSQAAAVGGADQYSTLEKLHDMLKKGILSQEEFDKKKAEILSRI